MVDQHRTRASNSVLVSFAAFVVVVAGLRAAQVIVIPVLVAAFLTLLTLPVLHWFQNKGLPTWLAMCGITAGGAIVGLVLVAVIGSSLVELRQQLPAYQERLSAMQASIDSWLVDRGLAEDVSVDRQLLDSAHLVSYFGATLTALGSLLNNALIVLFLLIFMQLEAADIPAKLHKISSEGSDVSARLGRIQVAVWSYVRLKTRLSLLTGGLVAAWLWLIGVQFPLLWGLLAFLFNFVPTIGSIIAAIPAVVVAALQPGTAGQMPTLHDSLLLAGIAAFGYVMINLVIGNVLEPRWMGSGVGLSTLVVFLSLVFWGWVLGPVGMVLSVPLTMIVKIVLDNSEEHHWVAVLLGPEVSNGAARATGRDKGSP